MYAYNEKVLQGSIQPSLVDMFIDKANSFDDKVKNLTLKFLNFRTPDNFAVIYLKFKLKVQT